jgi:hypothetical protein
MENLPVAIVGAGPVGLAALAELRRRGLDAIVLEAGPDAGHAVRQWAHVRMFSPWRYAIDAAAREILEAEGWTAPDPEALPTGRDLVERYLAPLAATAALRGSIRYGARVTGIARATRDKLRADGREEPFGVQYRTDAGTRTLLARAVIDASGTWGNPNPLGANGLPADGETDIADAIAYGIPDALGADRAAYAGKTVLVVGGGHSAINALLDLVALRDSAPGTRVLWGIRRAEPSRAMGGGAADALPARGELGTRLKAALDAGDIELLPSFRAERVARDGAGLAVGATIGHKPVKLAVDRIVVATGFRPDLAMLREVRARFDDALECTPALAPLIDPNVHSCGTVRPHGAKELAHPEKDFYVVGMKSYGRAPTFLLATGHEQVRSIAARLAGDIVASERVELVLPETGVCGTAKPRVRIPAAISVTADAEAGCCGGPPKADADACCVKDEVAKQEGKAGCGCG